MEEIKIDSCAEGTNLTKKETNDKAASGELRGGSEGTKLNTCICLLNTQ